MSDGEVLTIVQATIGVIASITMYDSGLDSDQLRALIIRRTHLVLLTPDA